MKWGPVLPSLIAWAQEDRDAYAHQRRLVEERTDLTEEQKHRAIADLDAWLAGREIEALRDRPSLAAELQLVWSGFWDLEGDRQIGAMGGIGPVPYVASSTWLTDHGIADPDRRRWYLHLWRQMDSQYLGHYNARIEKKSSSSAGTAEE